MTLISKNLKKLKIHFKDPLFKNSYFILLILGSISIFGLVFLIIVTRYYSPEDVGFASALQSISQLISAFSALGLNYGIIRFFAQRDDRNEMVKSCFSLVGLFSIIISVFILVTLQYWSPGLISLRENYFLIVSFIILTVLFSIFTLQGNVFYAARVMKLSFIQYLIFILVRLPLPIFFVSFGILGIILSWSVAVTIAFLIGHLWLIPKVLPSYKLGPKINMKILREIMPFSFGNYVSAVLEILPMLIIPVFIVNILEVKDAAYFLVAWAITAVTAQIPGAVATSLFAEGSSNQEIEFRSNLKKSIKLIIFLLIPTILFLLIFGDKVLSLFGQIYSENATKLLGFFMMGCIPLAINQIYFTINRVEMEVKPLIFVNMLIAVIVISGSYFLMKMFGLIGVGIAWSFGQGTAAVIVSVSLIKRYRTSGFLISKI
jgi:O-antigen/teichoic acid export membrane protein